MNYFIRKIITLATTLILVSIITFLVFQVLPGNPADLILGVDADPLQVEALNKKLEVDKPIRERYTTWITKAVKGDFGDSIKYQQSVKSLMKDRVQVTVSLTILCIFWTLLLGVPCAIWLTRNNGKINSILVSMISQIGLAMPSFWVGILMILLFAVKLKLLPSGGYVPWNQNPLGTMKALLMPSLAISISTIAVVIRYLKNTLLDSIKSDYVRTALAKGVNEKLVIYKHVLRNALIPVITIIGMVTADILGGSIVIENVFSLPGLGTLITSSINSRDLPLIQALVMYLAVIVVGINLFVDILYSIVDPRIRLK